MFLIARRAASVSFFCFFASIICSFLGGRRVLFFLRVACRTRGEINVLMCGDPGTSKSQLLAFVHKVSQPIRQVLFVWSVDRREREDRPSQQTTSTRTAEYTRCIHYAQCTTDVAVGVGTPVSGVVSKKRRDKKSGRVVRHRLVLRMICMYVHLCTT